MGNKSLQVRASGRSSTGDSTALLKATLTTHNLPQVLSQLSSLAVVRLVQTIGVEDCGEIVEHLSPKQLLNVLEEELWTSERAGEPEKFNPRQAMRWLRTWNELGPDRTCSILEGLGQEFMATLIVHFADVRELKGIAWDLLDLDGFGSILAEKAMPFRNIFDNFDLVARRKDPEEWGLFNGILTTLWENIPEFLLASLAFCCNRSHQDEYDDEKKGRGRIVEVEEILRDELSHARELRRKMAGYIDPEEARDLLRKCRLGCTPQVLREFLARQIAVSRSAAQEEAGSQHSDSEESFWQNDNAPDNTASRRVDPTSEETEQAREAASKCARSLETLIFSATNASKPVAELAAAQNTTESRSWHKHERPLVVALHACAHDDMASRRLQEELAGIANLLLSGCNVVNRKFEREEAFDAALGVVELGLSADDLCGPRFPEGGVCGAFLVGMQRLHRRVTVPTAVAFDELVRSRSTEHGAIHRRWIDVCLRREPGRSSYAKLAREGFFVELRKFLKAVEPVLPNRVAYSLRCLMSEFPVVPLALVEDPSLPKATHEWRFFASQEDFDLATKFSAHLGEMI